MCHRCEVANRGDRQGASLGEGDLDLPLTGIGEYSQRPRAHRSKPLVSPAPTSSTQAAFPRFAFVRPPQGNPRARIRAAHGCVTGRRYAALVGSKRRAAALDRAPAPIRLAATAAPGARCSPSMSTGSVSPYGGRGEIHLGTDPHQAVVLADFLNTAGQQSVRLTHLRHDGKAGADQALA